MINWNKHTRASGTIDLVSAFDELINFYEPETDTGERYISANRFLLNVMRLTELTSTATASLALAQALHMYDPERSL